ncbi:NADP-dependent glyceraldehyde-3-phosphate dehydrogenase [Trichinella pseudospiralis]
MSDAPLSPSFQQTMEDEEMQHAMEDWSKRPLVVFSTEQLHQSTIVLKEHMSNVDRKASAIMSPSYRTHGYRI